MVGFISSSFARPWKRMIIRSWVILFIQFQLKRIVDRCREMSSLITLFFIHGMVIVEGHSGVCGYIWAVPRGIIKHALADEQYAEDGVRCDGLMLRKSVRTVVTVQREIVTGLILVY